MSESEKIERLKLMRKHLNFSMNEMLNTIDGLLMIMKIHFSSQRYWMILWKKWKSIQGGLTI